MKARFLLLSLLGLSAGIASQAAAESIAVLNYQQILQASTAGKSAKEQLDAKQRAFQSEMSAKEDALKKEGDSLAQQHAVLSREAWERKAKDFRAKTTVAQKDMRTKRATLENALYSVNNDIQKAVLDIVGRISKQKGFTVVLPTAQLLYADPKLDITNEVLSQLNATMPRVTVNFKAPAASSFGDE